MKMFDQARQRRAPVDQTQELNAKILELRQQGKSWSEIRRQLGVTNNNITRAINSTKPQQFTQGVNGGSNFVLMSSTGAPSQRRSHLDLETVAEIREKFAAGHKIDSLSEEYGRSRPTIYKVVHALHPICAQWNAENPDDPWIDLTLNR